MRGSFLWRNRVVITTGALLLLALHLLSAGVSPNGRAAKPSFILMGLLQPVQTFEAHLDTNVSGFIRDYFQLVNVREENISLKHQMAQLESQEARLAEMEVENRHLRSLLDLKEALGMKAVAADVIGNDAVGLSRTLILSEGSNGGLQRNMAVISTQGVVGKIIAVSPDASRVLLIDDHNSALDAFDQRSRARGIIAGVVDDGLTMKYVDRTDDVKAGDTVVTSGMDGIFPRGLLIGRIVKVSQKGPGLFLKIKVKPAVDFSRLEQILVLTQKPPQLPADSKG